MKNKLSWSLLMESRTETRNKIQTPTLVAVVVGLHVAAVGSVMFIQGCGTTRPPVQETEPPAAVVMPPVEGQDETRTTPTAPVIRPSVAPTVTQPAHEDVEPVVYEVKRGDVLSRIASRHGVSAAEIMDLNNLADPNKIVIGQKLLLPPHAKNVSPSPAASTRPAPSASPSASAAVASGDMYEVKSGDSLSQIASNHGVKTRELAEANNITDYNKIRIGQKLVIPGGSSAPAPEPRSERDDVSSLTTPPSEPTPPPEAMTPAPVLAPALESTPLESSAFEYTVQPGDTLDLIARDFAIMPEDIIRMNNLDADEPLQPKQKLMIPSMPE